MEQKGGKKPTAAKKSASAKKQAEYVRFMFLTIVIGFIICIVVFFAVFSSISNKNKKNENKQQTSQIESQTSLVSEEAVERLAVIVLIASDKNKIGLYDIEKGNEISLVMKAGASMKDQYGQTMSLSQFVPGDIVQVAYHPNEMKYDALKIASKSWLEKSVQGLKFNTENKTIAFGNKLYKYNDKLITNYMEDYFDVAEIEAMDIVTIKGYNDVVWSVKLEKSHGSISIINKDAIKDGSIEIGTNIFKTLLEAEKMNVSEGLHKLVVKGSNIEAYTQDLLVEKGVETVIDLKAVKVKTANITIKTNVTDYKVYFNDQQKQLSEPVTLEYGTYTMKLLKDGYEEFTKEIIVNSEAVNLEVSMEKIELETTTQMGSLTVDTGTVIGVDVYVDNAYLGISPLKVKVEYGEHKVTVKKEGYTEISVPVTINEVPTDIKITMHQS